MKQKIPTPSKEELQNLYAREGSTISSLARHYSTNNPTVRKWLIGYNIPRKDHKQASKEANNRHRQQAKPQKEQLETLYKGSTIDSLEQYFNVSQQTIYNWLAEYDIKTRTLSESAKEGKNRQYNSIQFTREVLDVEYDRTKSIDELAEKLGVSRSHIRKQLIVNGIKIEPIEPIWRSKSEIELYEYLISEFPHDNWSHSNKTIIAPFELDIVNHDKKLAIEYCGLYWHSEASSGKKINYHKDKFIKCKEAGYKLITVFESDDQNKIKSLLLKLLGKTIKIGARKTILRELTSSEAMKFHKEHHLHSAVGGKFHYGLYYNGELVMAASFGSNRFGSKQQFECSRITSHSNYTVVGGVSKIIKNFIDSIKPDSIITFADLRFGAGDVYKHCGFEYVTDTPPNYWYSKKYTQKLFSRVKFQKHKLAEQLEYFDPLKTEFENMLDNGWDRIWDCGNAKYVWKK